MERENRDIIADGKIDYFPWDAVNQIDTTKKVLLVDGTLLRTKETGIYLLEDGKKYPFISPEVFNTYNYKYDNVQVIDSKTLNRIPTAQAMPVRSGELIKTSNNPDLYVIESGKKRHIVSPDVFLQAKYKWENIRIVSQTVMNIHPMGDKFEDPKYIVDGSVFMQFNNGVVKVKENGKLRSIPDPATFLSHYKSWDIIRALGADSTFKTYGLEIGRLLQPLDRTLVADNYRVYLIEN